MTTGIEKPKDMSEVEKLARLVRRILLFVIWGAVILGAVALINELSDETDSADRTEKLQAPLQQ